MKRLTLLAIVFMVIIKCHGQNTIHFSIKDAETKEPLTGASVLVKGTTTGTTTDDTGSATLSGIPDGIHVLQIRFIGYRSQTDSVEFPSANNSRHEVLMEPEGEELEEVIISSTRSSRTFEDIPTRVEFISGEELEEKANMKPGDIRMLLSESTGIQTQQTSATTANSSIRIQGLDGRYTQILKDGFPLYAGFSGGLGLLQTPPLDLKQVEVVKGSSSTLYGGGAIAGLVNLISKVPREERELRFLVNGTSAKGLDLNGFYAEQFKKIGLTVYAARNSAEPYDPADIDLTAIPEYDRYTVNPRLFISISEKTRITFGINANVENRIGGDLHFIKGNGDNVHSYFERNKSQRLSTQFSFDHKTGETGKWNLKNSLSRFKRIVTTPGYLFEGDQSSTFTEFSYSVNKERSEWITGANLLTDDFHEEKLTATPLRNYSQTTLGAFIQNNRVINRWLNLESGLRGDYVIEYGFALLPRVSALFKFSDKITSRLGGGFGYKAPTIFTEESERIQYNGVLPVSEDDNKIEKSYGANWDVNYKTSLFDDQLTVSINHLFFYTYLDDPLFLTPESGMHRFVNLEGYTDSKGTETNVKLEFGDFKVFLGYTFTDTKIHAGAGSVQNPLTPKNRINSVLMYEVEDKWKIGAEAYYFGKQRLSDGATGKEYWICGFMVEKLWEHVSLFINFENFLDARQTRFDTIYTGSVSNPAFRDIYAPLDGFVTNGGIKLHL
jgi:outer membrane receptor for ferrienterochelin and colicins